jgi:hypothetical protein
MDVSGALSLRMLAYTLDTARSNVAAAQAQPATPEAQSDVILSLSAAASALLTGHPK